MGNNKIIGAKIKNIRESKQLSIEEVAERSGLGIEQIERIEGNLDFPSLAPLIKIARVLGVRLGTFLNGVVEINYGKNTYILEEGDSIYYDSIVAHHVHAAADNKARILGVVYTPY